MALPTGDETILLTEDEQLVRDLASKVLRACGYTVLVAAHPHDALKLSAQHDGPIHLLLSDIVMPDMTGPQLAKKILAGRPETRLLLMSGYADGVLDQLGYLDTAGEFLQKPFTPHLLAKQVRQILDMTQVSN